MTASGVADETRGAGTELCATGAEACATGVGGGGTEGAATGGGGGGGAEGARTGSEYAALGIGGGVESRWSAAEATESSVPSGGVGAGKPIKVAACERMLGMPGSDPGSGAGADSTACAITGSGAGSSGGAGGTTEAAAEGGGSDAGRGVNDTRSGWSMTCVTSFESSKPFWESAPSPQSVSISSVDGGMDGSIDGLSLVRRGGTEDDRP